MICFLSVCFPKREVRDGWLFIFLEYDYSPSNVCGCRFLRLLTSTPFLWKRLDAFWSLHFSFLSRIWRKTWLTAALPTVGWAELWRMPQALHRAGRLRGHGWRRRIRSRCWSVDRRSGIRNRYCWNCGTHNDLRSWSDRLNNRRRTTRNPSRASNAACRRCARNWAPRGFAAWETRWKLNSCGRKTETQSYFYPR